MGGWAGLRYCAPVFKTTVILNRHARRLKRGAFAQRVEAALRASLVGAHIVRSRTVGEARTAIAQSQGEVVVVGGDGAINLALDVLPDGTVLGLIPAGTANDLARALDMSLVPEDAAQAVHRPARAIDLLVVNGRRFCTTGGIGLPAQVAKVSNRLKKVRGLSRVLGHQVYTAVAGGHILGRPGLRRTVTVAWTCALTGQPRTLTSEVYGVLVTNVGSVAGGLVLCDAQLDDGVFEICLLPARGRLRLLELLWSLTPEPGEAPRRARAGALPVLRARSARLECDEATDFFGDGEILAHGQVFEIRLERRAVRVAGVG